MKRSICLQASKTTFLFKIYMYKYSSIPTHIPYNLAGLYYTWGTLCGMNATIYNLCMDIFLQPFKAIPLIILIIKHKGDRKII